MPRLTSLHRALVLAALLSSTAAAAAGNLDSAPASMLSLFDDMRVSRPTCLCGCHYVRRCTPIRYALPLEHRLHAGSPPDDGEEREAGGTSS